MKIWNPKKNDYDRYPKNYGWTCFEDKQMIEALKGFFLYDDHIRIDVIKTFLGILPKIRNFVSKGLWTLYASSVLFVYEGDSSPSSSQPPTAFMIDFAHSWKVCITLKKNMRVFFVWFLIGFFVLGLFVVCSMKAKKLARLILDILLDLIIS